MGGLSPKVYTWLCGLFASASVLLFFLPVLDRSSPLSFYSSNRSHPAHACCSAGLGSIIFGYDLGVIAGVLPADDFKRVMGPRYLNPNLQGLITSIFGASFHPLKHDGTVDWRSGESPRMVRSIYSSLHSDLSSHIRSQMHSFFGMVPVAYIADRFGRRKTIQFGAAVYMSVFAFPCLSLRLLSCLCGDRVGGVLQTAAQNMNMMFAGRFFAGSCLFLFPNSVHLN
jgi:hypothetical protein